MKIFTLFPTHSLKILNPKINFVTHVTTKLFNPLSPLNWYIFLNFYFLKCLSFDSKDNKCFKRLQYIIFAYQIITVKNCQV